MTQRTCKACGRPVTFARTDDGKVIPLDISAPVYELEVDVDGQEFRAVRSTSAHVTHFATCPKTSQFSRGRDRGAR